MQSIYRKCLPSMLILFIIPLFFVSSQSISHEIHKHQTLRVLTWEGYVTDADVLEVNKRLEESGYHYQVEIILPYAQGAEQMFDLIRAKHCDIAFLTLFFIKMQKERTAKLLQVINTSSPRLSNYKYIYPNLTGLEMGMNGLNQPLYIPWGGGIYGFYINKDKVTDDQVPTSINALWKDEWHRKFSLNQSQQWYNLGLAFMSQGLSPFYMYEALVEGDRNKVRELSKPNSMLQHKLTELYLSAGGFWKTSPEFNNDLLIISSWGPEIHAENAKGANWQLIDFNEGHMAWLDTINFVKGLEGEKLEAAEIFANYFIGKQVQSRVANELSMVPVSKLAPINPLLGGAQDIFKENMFVPPYNYSSYELMKKMTDKASLAVEHSKKNP